MTSLSSVCSIKCEYYWSHLSHQGCSGIEIFLISPQGNEIFQTLSTEEYNEVIQLLEQAILATDLALYFKWVFFMYPFGNSLKIA